MSFSSPIFLFGLLPWFCLAAWMSKNRIHGRKTILFAGNIIFYIWGGIGGFLFVILYSFLIWLLSMITRKRRNQKNFFPLSIILAVSPLLYVKYVSFFVHNLNALLNLNLKAPTVFIPIGISFFTFEAVSLLVDLRTGSIPANPTFPDIFLYLTFLPVVSSGPITRYSVFEQGLRHPCEEGIIPATERIVLGLCKKVLVADKIAPLANYYFNGVAADSSFSMMGLWIGSAAFSLQLYYDFSGYTDMAIGIGKLLGFELPENFDHPYIAKSISEFWRRWHISLSRWFRDYIYIPMGGNRCSVRRHILNLMTVWLLTGIWHGADWTFVIWGIGYFILLVSEKYVSVMKRLSRKWYGHIYTLFCVNLLWVLFRAENVSAAEKYIAGMFRLSGDILPEQYAVRFLPYLLVAMIMCLPWKSYLQERLNKQWVQTGKRAMILLLGVLAICAVINSNYAPYIYGAF